MKPMKKKGKKKNTAATLDLPERITDPAAGCYRLCDHQETELINQIPGLLQYHHLHTRTY